MITTVTHNATWRYFAYRLHTCCPVMFELREGYVLVDWEHPANARSREDCGGCQDAKREHDWGDV